VSSREAHEMEVRRKMAWLSEEGDMLDSNSPRRARERI